MRCFSILDSSELKQIRDRGAQPDGGHSVCLELYKKPTDFSKKRLNLHTIKPLYLHLRVEILAPVA